MTPLVGKVIKHEKFLDVALLVTSVGNVAHDATEIHVSGMWMNQGFVRSWMIGASANLTIKIEDFPKWSYCTNEDQNPCLRKCDWAAI